MNDRHYFITVLSVLILFASCSESKKKAKTPQSNKQTTEWKFSKEIQLNDISPIGIVAQDDLNCKN